MGGGGPDAGPARRSGIEIRPLRASDAPRLVAAFSEIGWDKPAELFLTYVEEERTGRRAARMAVLDDDPAGYITVQWSSEDATFAERGIPEIKDLNVLPRFRRDGVGSELLRAAEELIAERSAVAGIRVGLHAGYGAAQRLYVRRGYVPDGSGAVDAAGEGIPEGARVALDDDPTLRLVKKLVEGVPDDSSVVIPRLFCRDPDQEIDFCVDVLGAAELGRRPGPDGSVAHALLTIGPAMIMIEAEWPALPSRAPAPDGSSPVVIFVYVEDVDAAVERAVAAGARVLRPPEDQFWGDRIAWMMDPAGHVWTVATRIEATTAEERDERWEAILLEEKKST